MDFVNRLAAFAAQTSSGDLYSRMTRGELENLWIAIRNAPDEASLLLYLCDEAVGRYRQMLSIREAEQAGVPPVIEPVAPAWEAHDKAEEGELK